MSSGLVIRKSLIGKQDVLFGRRTQTQTRAKGVYEIGGVVLVYPVNSVNELKNLNPEEYDTAFIVGESILATVPEDVDVNLNGNNEFYYFDFASEEDEDIPNVITSSVVSTGRWKLAKVGENRILQVVEDQFTQRVPEIKEDILDEVKIEIPAAVEEGLEILQRQGGLYDSELDYAKNQFVRAFVKTPIGVESRLYMSSTESADEAPISGTIYSNDNGIEIFNSDGLVESTQYIRLQQKNSNSVKITLQNNKTFKFLGGGAIPSGTLKCRVYKSDSVTSYFEVVFPGTSIADFAIRNVMYAASLKTAAITSSYGYIFYPGFAIFCDGTYFGLSVALTNQADYMIIDYSDFNQIPTLQTSTSFLSSTCYAIREGGGSYIPDIGTTFFSLRKSGYQSGVSENFYNFMSGSIPWITGITLDTGLYHQYSESCVMPTMDASGRFDRNVSTSTKNSVGTLGDQSLPDIQGTVYLNRGYYGAYGNNQPIPQQYKGEGAFSGTDTSTYSNINFTFAASNYSSIYKDGADVLPNHILFQKRLQIF